MTILSYHAVDPDWTSPLSVTPQDFASHIGWLSSHRRIVSLEEAVTRLDRQWRLPHPYVALTFDDGFESLFTHALPILRRHSVPATVFVVAETLTVAGREVDWVDTVPAWPLRTLDAHQVHELHDSGIAIGSHSYRHDILAELSDAECERDLRDSRELLEDLLGETVPHLAYPRGQHNASVRAAAKRAGYGYAFTLPEGREPLGRYSVPRVGVYPGNGPQSLRLKTQSWYLSARTSPAYPALRRLVGRPLAPARVG